jgi:hypothetical protein
LEIGIPAILPYLHLLMDHCKIANLKVYVALHIETVAKLSTMG